MKPSVLKLGLTVYYFMILQYSNDPTGNFAGKLQFKMYLLRGSVSSVWTFGHEEAKFHITNPAFGG